MKRVIDAIEKLGQVLLLLILAGCAAPSGAASQQIPELRATDTPPTATLSARAAEQVYVTGLDKLGVDRVFLLDAASGAPQHVLPRGYISPDWSTLFEVAPARDSTVIRAYDLATGALVKETTVAGLYDVPAPPEDPRQSAFSPDGRELVLWGRPTPAEELAWNQTGQPPATRILVVDTTFRSPPQRINFDGYFWFDTIGSGSLYLIEVLGNDPGRAPEYQVRRYDLAAGRLDENVVVDKSEPGPMNGNRRVAVASADGVWLYSLYTRDREGPFVHVLNLRDRYAVCADLPFVPGRGDFESELLWSLVLSPDQGTLYAVNGALGQVAAVDTTNFQVRGATFVKPAARRPVLLGRIGNWLTPAAEAKRLVYSGAAVSPDGQTLLAVADSGLVTIATRDLTVSGRYLAGWSLSSLAISPNGADLYAVSAEKPAILRLGLPFGEGESAPEDIATGVRPTSVLRVVVSDR